MVYPTYRRIIRWVNRLGELWVGCANPTHRYLEEDVEMKVGAFIIQDKEGKTYLEVQEGAGSVYYKIDVDVDLYDIDDRKNRVLTSLFKIDEIVKCRRKK